MPSFNVLTDPWGPLDDGAGRPARASCVELICGGRDAADLVHPRDDERSFSRMLLSALTQALLGDRVWWFFWRWLDARTARQDIRNEFRDGVRKAALGMFHEATSVPDGDPDARARVVVERSALSAELQRALGLRAPSEKGAARARKARPESTGAAPSGRAAIV